MKAKKIKKPIKKKPLPAPMATMRLSKKQIDEEISELQKQRNLIIDEELEKIKNDEEFLSLKKEYNSLIKKMKSYKFPSFKITPIIYDCDEGLEYFDSYHMFYDTCNLDNQLEEIKDQLDDIFTASFSKDVKLIFNKMNKLAIKYNTDVYDLENMFKGVVK